MLNEQNNPRVKQIHCDSFRRTRPKYFQTSNLKDIFKNIKPEDILSFLKKLLFFENLTKSTNLPKSDQIQSNDVIKTHTLNSKIHLGNKTNLMFLALNDPLTLICR